MSQVQTTDFLLEIGTEELPPGQIDNLAQALSANLTISLKKLALHYGEVKTFSTPRRLAIIISGLATRQEDQTLDLRGPPVKIAFDPTGKPTTAAIKFAESCGVNIAKLDKIEDEKGVFLCCSVMQKGKKTIELLPHLIYDALKKLPIKKPMHWGSNVGPFVRPIHWLVALWGSKIIKLEICGIKATNKTFGHRFLYPKPLTIIEPNQYENLLENTGFVIPDANKRQNKILDQITSLAKDDKPIITDDLLPEVTNLVEWPVGLMGTFNAKFLKIPREVLIATLKNHQRSFPLVDEDGEILPRFIIISNIVSKTPKQVIGGNEKVVNARLADAEYFYQNDLKQNFADNLNRLQNIAFQENLGSLYDKTLRLKAAITFIAKKIGADITLAERAAELSKCDLVTSMVWEFPELQGIMGYYYASILENQKVAIALKEHYHPRFAQDQIPATKIGIALALADRIDNLIGFFAINKIPSGDKDPFGLRRAAGGILKIILEKRLTIDLKELLDNSCLSYGRLIKNPGEITAKILDFIYERLRSLYIEQNKNINIFRAILAATPTDILDFTQRFDALDKCIKLQDVSDLIEIYKRIKNILQQNHLSEKIKFDPVLLIEPAEKDLAQAQEKWSKIITNLYQEKYYYEILEELIKLKPFLDNFFAKVMVMTEDKKLCSNRLALLKSIQYLFLAIADFSYLISGTK